MKRSLTFAGYLLRYLPHMASESRRPMRALFSAALGQPLDDADRTALEPLLGGRALPDVPVAELVVIAGRGSGKTEMLAALASYLALCRKWKRAPGVVPTGLLLCATVNTALIALRFLTGQLRSHPDLEQLIERETAQRVEFRNGTAIEVVAASEASFRGYSCFLGGCDELAHWSTSDGSANQDADILVALGGALRFDGALLVAISTPYGQSGALFEHYERSFGRDDPRTLVAGGSTLQFNATASSEKIEAAIKRDPERYLSEYAGLHFRQVSGAFIERAVIEQCTRHEPIELPQVASLSNGSRPAYVGAVDLSAEGDDPPAAAVVHTEGDKVVVDAVRAWPSRTPADAVAVQVKALLAAYGISSAVRDQYGGGIAQRFYEQNGVVLQLAANNTSDTLLDFGTLLRTGMVELPPCPVLKAELLGLQRSVGARGKDYVSHQRYGHDDRAVACARACVAAAGADRTLEVPTLIGRSTILSGWSDGGFLPHGDETVAGMRGRLSFSWNSDA
jgi:hypothetical protein